MHKIKTSIPSLMLGFMALSGCAVGTDYTPPDVPTPKAWIAATPDQQPSAIAVPATAPHINLPAAVDTHAEVQITFDPDTPAATLSAAHPPVAAPTPPDPAMIEQEWWKQLHDPVLDELVARALNGNFDLKIAEARIEQARAMRSSSVASLLPTGDVKANASREANELAFPQEAASLKQPFNLLQTGFDASWELDVFGGLRRGLEASSSELQASEADLNNIRVSLLAEIARTYIDIRQYQEQIAIAKSIVDIEHNSVAISQQRFKAGDSPGIDVSQAQAQAEQTEAQLPVYENLLKQSEFQLDVLLGSEPGAVAPLVEQKQPLPMPGAQLILDAPAAVIANRPDIRAAERRLQEATAQQGVALAKFFPDISLSGFLGLLSTDAGTLFTTANKSWSAGASVLWPILNYGQLSANLDYADAKQKEALATYQKTVIAALSDVERAVTAYNRQREHYAVLQRVEQENQHSTGISRARYREGMTSFLEVLVAEQSLYNASSQREQAAAELAQDFIAVYKSLGHGWKTQAHKAPG